MGTRTFVILAGVGAYLAVATVAAVRVGRWLKRISTGAR